MQHLPCLPEVKPNGNVFRLLATGVFVSVMGFALLVYVILDGYDLGIGMLLPLADEQQKRSDDRRHRALLGCQ